MQGRRNMYRVTDRNGKPIFEDLLTAREAAEEINTTIANVGQAALSHALVNKKYRIIQEDTKLSRKLDFELLAEWDRYRKWMLGQQGGKCE